MNTNQIELLKKLNNSWITKKRQDGTYFTVSIDESLQDTVREMHGTDILPDDFRYKILRYITNQLAEYYSHYSVDEISNHRDEVISDMVSVYNHELLSWLSSHSSRLEFCDAAKVDNCPENADMISIISMGQYLEIDQIFSNVLDTLESLESDSEEAV